jgi:exosortase/archaeosortase family protein
MAIGIPSSPPTLPALRLGRPALAGIAAAGLGALALSLFSSWRADLFAAGAARVAAGLLGAGLRLGATGQVVVWGEGTVTVTAACSGTDFFLMVAALLGWRLARADRPLAATIPAALLGVTLAVPVTLLVNGLRIAAVAQAHRWLIPLLPERHGAFAHMLTGVAVFLPALIALNLALEFYARRHRPAASR